MCGIVGVVRRPSRREPPQGSGVVAELDAALRALEAAQPVELTVLDVAAGHIEEVDALLRGVPGVRMLLEDRAAAVAIEDRSRRIGECLAAVELELDAHGSPADELEDFNETLVRAKDALWAVQRDRLRNARAVGDLAGAGASLGAIEAFTSIQVALSAIDRLEVRGRDSAGLLVMVRNHGLNDADPAVTRLLDSRVGDALFTNRAVRRADGALAFVYKAAAEIGELGDNVAALRAAIRDDELLHLAVSPNDAQAVVLGHTRWASVGIISEPNAHPLDHTETNHSGATAAYAPLVIGALNGDVDNYADLEVAEGLSTAAEITTDAKVIPTLVSRALAAGRGADDAFRTTVGNLEGSVAVGVAMADAPGSLHLALRGSGQALYVGLAEDAFVIASEPYGLVEESSTYLRLDGETPADPARPGATRGQVVVVDGNCAGDLEGIRRLAYDGTPLPVHGDDLQRAQITTRDIDRGDYPHFLLKEISEAPDSFRKTLRGKVVEGSDGRLTVQLPPAALTDDVRRRLADGSIRRVLAIGQGTAAVAGAALAHAVRSLVGDRLIAEGVLATELSGFGMSPDMRDTLVVAISQSGTTTDTNRSVDLVRARGAAVVAIVNRRNSNLCDRSDGVLYTSDGRDVEMSVASTKAFYSQVAAGYLLALGIAAAVDGLDENREHELLTALRALPDAMRAVIDQRGAIAEAAPRHVLSRRSWAVVGNGPNAIAARELRIKLSELCYKAIAWDSTEDKKHIDLSSEPLTIVCAAGLAGSNVDDVGKEVAIYRAHRGVPLVIASDGSGGRFGAAAEVITVPAVHPALDFVLSTVAGHLFCYEAALAIDGTARPLREARAAIEASVAGPVDDLLTRLAPAIEAPARRFLEGLRAGRYDGSLEASTGVRIASLFRYATGISPLDAYELEHGKVGTPSTVVQDLTAALTRGIEELTRPIDAIKHQAKTVTVGISRADETLLHVPLVAETIAAGAPRDGLSYQTLRTLMVLDAAVYEVTGFTRYRVEGDPAGPDATVHVVDRGGVAVGLPSRTDVDPRLTGTKHRVATQRLVTAVRGARDGRTIVMVPEIKQNQTVGITLLHVRFADRLAPAPMRAVLEGYQGRYSALVDAVTETESTFDDARLGSLPVIDLLTEPVYVLADHWRTP
jgi:glucosamine--fructose-6-phosphate aminotransferase (isomerizing)